MEMNTPDRVLTFNRPSVWLEFSPLSNVTNSVNLGQGFPDWAPPEFLEKIAAQAVQGSNYSGYARSAGHGELVKTLSQKYSETLNHKIVANEEILVTVGATEALFLSIMSFIGKGDEVITIEPAFDIYYGALAMAEAVIKPVPLLTSKNTVESASDFLMDWEKLESSLNSNTKAIILNTPHNPTGKVFTRDELERLSSLLKKYPQCLVISDEVYEHIVYDDNKHISIASIDGMFERTLSIYSAGKTFSVTGWKIGWIIGPKKLLKRLQLCQQWIVFSVATPLQQAISDGLKEALNPYNGHSNYYEWLKAHYIKKREILFSGLKNVGLNPVLPQGSFFILCDISKIKICNEQDIQKIKKLSLDGKIQIDHSTLDYMDYSFCRSLTLNQSVTAIPTSAFYREENKEYGKKWARFAFCKEDTIIKKAMKNLRNLTKKT